MFITNETLVRHHHYNFYDIDNMYPFERDIYVTLINSEEKKKQLKTSPEELLALGIEPKWQEGTRAGGIIAPIKKNK